jgi:hypothetical protein
MPPSRASKQAARWLRYGAVASLAVLTACAPQRALQPLRGTPSAEDAAFLDDVQHRTFNFFWQRSDPRTGLTPDRWPTPSFSSIAAVGFALTAYGIGVEHRWVTREQAAERTLTTLRFFLTAPQGPEPTGRTGYHGFFYHFLDMPTGVRFQTVELSTIDTALLLGGVLFAQSYFTGGVPSEVAIRATADSLYRRVEWTWIQPNPPLVNHRWRPEDGFGQHDWRGYDESMLLYVLALGSPSFPIATEAWPAYTTTYQWADFQGQAHVNFEPLFGHQYSHIWLDFRGIRDAYMRQRGIDYFENSRRATLAQRSYAVANPMGWTGYGATIWGITACDGPLDSTITIGGRSRTFHTYWARGVAAREIRDDGTIAPTAAGGSMPFAPELALPALKEMRGRYGEIAWGEYGFFDAFNPTLTATVPVRHGRVHPTLGWADTDYLGIDQGPIVAMIENYRTGLVWRVMRANPYIVNGLRRAGFTGGWIDAAPAGFGRAQRTELALVQ